MSEEMDELLGLFNSLDANTYDREIFLDAPFAWPGGKSRSRKHILPLLPYREKYGEVFGGSGAILLSRNESPLEVFNDRYSGVTKFYRVVRDPEKCQLLIKRLEEICYSREEFIWCRDTWDNCNDEIERAARWFYMIKMSFASKGTVFGRSKTGPMLPKSYHNSLELFTPVSQRLKHVLIENLDWRQCLKDFDDPEMVWYLDPEYPTATKGHYQLSMSWADHVELLERIFQLEGFVAISSYPNELYDRYIWDQVETWEVKTSGYLLSFDANNHAADKQDVYNRPYATECLYIKEST